MIGSSTLARLLLAASLLAATVVAADDWQQVSSADRRAISPEITAGPDGTIHLIWLDKGLTADRPPPKPRKPGEHSHRSTTDLYYSQSTDNGASWSTPVRVNNEAGAVWGFQVSKPRIAVGETGTIHIFFPGNERSPATGLDTVTAQYTRSTDGGKSFADPITLHQPAGFDQRDLLGEGLAATFSFGTMGQAADGSIYASWQDIRRMGSNADGADAYLVVSRDDGKTFSKESRALGDMDVCPCCQLTMAFGDESMLIGYRRIYPDGRDSAVGFSANGDMDFESVARLPFGGWKIDGCPLKPTELAVDGERVFAASYTGGEEPAGVYLARSLDGGRSFQDPLPVHPGAAYSDAPALSVSGNGVLQVVWQGKTGGDRRLFLAESTDQGKSLSEPRELPAPPGNASYPVTARGSDGSLLVAWQHAGEQVLVTRVAPGPAQVAGD